MSITEEQFDKLFSKLSVLTKEYKSEYIFSACTELYKSVTREIVERISANDWKYFEDEDEVHDEIDQLTQELLELWLPGLSQYVIDAGITFPNDFDLEFQGELYTCYQNAYGKHAFM